MLKESIRLMKKTTNNKLTNLLKEVYRMSLDNDNITIPKKLVILDKLGDIKEMWGIK